MKFWRIVATLCLIAFHQLPVYAQSTQWGQLLINLPVGWGSNMKAGNLVYSNYNINGSEPFSITLFKAETFSGKADSLFYQAWKKYLADDLPSPEAPRPRKWFTENELPLFTATKELKDKSNPAYYVFGIYVLQGYYQAFLIHTQMANTYKNVQSEWQERLLQVGMATVKK